MYDGISDVDIEKLCNKTPEGYVPVIYKYKDRICVGSIYFEGGKEAMTEHRIFLEVKPPSFVQKLMGRSYSYKLYLTYKKVLRWCKKKNYENFKLERQLNRVEMPWNFI